MTRNDPPQPQLPSRRHGRQERGSSRAAFEVPKAVVDRRLERVAAASKRSSSRASPACRMHFPQAKVDKSIVDATRKRTSFTYLSTKLHGMFRREHRDTIACEEDEEPPARNRSLRDLYRLGTSSRAVPTTTHVDDMGTGSSGGDSSSTTTTTSATAAAAMATSGPSAAVLVEYHNQPSREQRWCTNCSKCFQRGLSRYDQYCGLDCKTAHRMRQIA